MELVEPSPPLIDISSLPDISEPEKDFRDTSFFRQNQRLPTPIEVLKHSQGQIKGVVKFEALNLAVKVGDSSTLHLEEAQTMIALRKVFPNGEIPVPEVFGWKRLNSTNFIYMSAIPGKTLGQSWPSLTNNEKESICEKLADIVAALRRISQGTAGPFIGMPLTANVFTFIKDL
jgi:aminoglycoside phosphotransferase